MTGACGLLGAHVMAGLSHDFEVVGVDRHAWWGDLPARVHQTELGDRAAMEALLRQEQPDLIVHCAAMVDVDRCEREPALAHAVNAQLTERLARAAGPRPFFLYLSTDAVFDGREPFASEETPPHPVSAYGRSKWAGEQAVARATPHHLILRTNFYGWSSGRKRTFGEWLYQALSAGEPTTLFADVFFTPLYVVDLVDRIVPLLQRRVQGLVHVAGRDRVSKHEFGAALARVAGLSLAGARPGSVDDAGLDAPRPNDLSLSCRRAEQWTGLPAPGCLEGLRRFVADRGRPLSARCGAASVAR